jgi:hypothetical protein
MAKVEWYDSPRRHRDGLLVYGFIPGKATYGRYIYRSRNRSLRTHYGLFDSLCGLKFYKDRSRITMHWREVTCNNCRRINAHSS